MRRRVLVVRPTLQPPTGGSAVAAWMLEALRGRHHVGVLTWEPVDLGAINRYYGTSLQPADLTVHRLPAALTRCVPGTAFELWKYGYLLRRCRQMHAEYDVFLSASNEADFGVPGIQYVHYPRFLDPRINPRVTAPIETSGSWYHRSRPLMQTYFRWCGFRTGFLERIRGNLTLVNSAWTGRHIAAAHGITATTVYPPVPNDFPAVAWEKREHGFVCIGRIAPVKRLESIIAILHAVRQRGHDIHLHIIGAPLDREYFDRIQRLQREHAAWVQMDLNLPHADLAQLVARHKFGIHARRPEHFGIAVAEMVNAGCLVFAPSDGGQVEIIGDRPELIYHSEADAAEKIDHMLRTPDQQRMLRQHLAARRQLFSTEAFMRQMRTIVEQFPDVGLDSRRQVRH